MMPDPISDDLIDAYLARVAVSNVLGKSVRRQKLLDYLIRTEAAGQGETLKAYAIGLDVFDKSADFDPSTDSSVRVEIGRLRAALALFEGSSFADTMLEVDVPVGTYRPVLSHRQPQVSAAPTGRNYAFWAAIVGGLAAVALVVFIVFDQVVHHTAPVTDGEAVRIAVEDFAGNQAVARAASAALRATLVRSPTISVSLSADGSWGSPRADFLLRGVIGDSPGLRVHVELVNVATDRVVWSNATIVPADADPAQYIADTLGSELRVRVLGASKEVLEGRDPASLTPEQLFIMATWVPGPATNAVAWERERIDLMQMALDRAPDFGAAHSVMADKLAYLANMSPPSDTPERRAEALFHARRAMELSPADPDVVFNVAQSYWHAGRVSQSLVLMRRVTELDPGHDLAQFLSQVIPYTCAVAPDDVVLDAIAFDAQLSADNPIRWLTLTWVAWLHMHRGQYDLALDSENRAAAIFEIPYTFMRHAVLFYETGDVDAAVEVIVRQRNNWPDVSPDHFADVTIPRLCAEADDPAPHIARYRAMADALADRL